MNTKLAADHLCKTYGSRTILRDLSFSVEEGTSMAITGPSGSGKSTLLNIIGLLDTPTGGAITLDGQPLPGIDGAGRPCCAAARSTTCSSHTHSSTT